MNTAAERATAVDIAGLSAAADRTGLLDVDGDIADPLGGTVDDYLACAERISAALRQRIRELEL